MPTKLYLILYYSCLPYMVCDTREKAQEEAEKMNIKELIRIEGEKIYQIKEITINEEIK